MMTSSKEKLTLYLPTKTIAETKSEAERLDRSQSWIMQTAWRVARETIQQMPGVNDYHVPPKQDK